MRAWVHPFLHCCFLLSAKDDSTSPAAEQQYCTFSTKPQTTMAMRRRTSAFSAERSSLRLCDIAPPNYEAFASHGRVRFRSPCEVGV